MEVTEKDEMSAEEEKGETCKFSHKDKSQTQKGMRRDLVPACLPEAAVLLLMPHPWRYSRRGRMRP